MGGLGGGGGGGGALYFTTMEAEGEGWYRVKRS